MMDEQKEFMFAVKAYNLSGGTYCESISVKSITAESGREQVKNWLMKNDYVDIEYITAMFSLT